MKNKEKENYKILEQKISDTKQYFFKQLIESHGCYRKFEKKVKMQLVFCMVLSLLAILVALLK